MSTSHFLSPLRYPGGKRKLSNFVKLVFRINNLTGGVYAEPYAGGAAVALSLLFGEYAQKIYINDIDRSIYAFWKAALEQPEKLCQKIVDTPVSVEEWERQREVQYVGQASYLDLGFSTFYLNRTNRSGIIRGGLIGGKAQEGIWKIDARFNKEELVQRIAKISRYRSRIRLSNLDASVFLENLRSELNGYSLVYLDPPYYEKGGELYVNHYEHSDHAKVAEIISGFETPWLVTYDDVSQIKKLYSSAMSLKYGLHYSAQDRYKGSEIMFYSRCLELPEVSDPARIKKHEFNTLQRELEF